jgi:hypothetical protein
MGPVVIRCAEQPSMLDRHCKFTRFGYRKFIKVRYRVFWNGLLLRIGCVG